MNALLMQKVGSETLLVNVSNLVKQNGFRIAPKAVKQISFLFRWILNRRFFRSFRVSVYGMLSLGFFFLSEDGEMHVTLGMFP